LRAILVPCRHEPPEVIVELRRHHRVPFTEPVAFSRKGSDKHSSGESEDISLGGMFIKTAMPEPFGSEIVVHVHVPGEPSAYALPGIVRWTGGGGMGVQFGLLGAKETHTITELVAANERET
jgi:PilZ domain-containing protein